jgi:CubicO group peptidase (beta-lactamase class C family)
MNAGSNIKSKFLDAVNKTLSNFKDMHGEIAVSYEDEILYNESFTYADAPWMVDKNSQYLIASVTKQFTATALLKVLHDKQIVPGVSQDAKALKDRVQEDLHKPVSYFLHPKHQIWDGNMPDWANAIKIHHLLTHTSGIKKKNQCVFDKILEYTPGQQFLYSNPNYVLIGTIISEITKSPLDLYFYEVLFKPAGMESTYLPLAGTQKSLRQQDDFKNLALGFEYDLLPLKISFSEASEKINFEELNVAGGIISTIKDCIKWNNALYSGKIIPKSLVDLMLIQHTPTIPLPTYHGLDKIWYGYGMEVYYDYQKICYQHTGGCPGYQSRLIYLPVYNTTIVHLSNSQEDNVSYNAEKKKISDEYQCDDVTTEAIFDGILL